MYYDAMPSLIKPKTACPDLYAELSGYGMLVFKGDLNYRKLLGDRLHDVTCQFNSVLGSFAPAPFCALRTLKSDTLAGVGYDRARGLDESEVGWRFSGKYAVLQGAGWPTPGQ